MPDSFVPLVPPSAEKPREAAFAAMAPGASAPSAKPPANGKTAPAEPCAKPVVTLQRSGDVVSGIRIQCGCGQVIDLACAY